jgi:hypothetical protein
LVHQILNQVLLEVVFVVLLVDGQSLILVVVQKRLVTQDLLKSTVYHIQGRLLGLLQLRIVLRRQTLNLILYYLNVVLDRIRIFGTQTVHYIQAHFQQLIVISLLQILKYVRDKRRKLNLILLLNYKDQNLF